MSSLCTRPTAPPPAPVHELGMARLPPFSEPATLPDRSLPIVPLAADSDRVRPVLNMPVGGGANPSPPAPPPTEDRDPARGR